jgi:Secretion system C-terminal sorting domain
MPKFITVLFLVLFSFSAFAQSSLIDFRNADVSGTSILEAPMAPIVFLDQAPNQVNGLFADSNCLGCGTLQQSIAENFIVATAGPTYGITEVVIWGGYFPENIPNSVDDFTIIVHSDDAGAPGAVIDSRTGLEATTRATTGVVLFGVDEYMFTFDFSASPIMIASAGTYWIEIFNNSVESSNFFWETGDLDVTLGIAGSAWITTAPGTPPWNLDGATDLAVQINGDDAVPVELSSFTASVNENDVTLNWVTASEINNQGFEIERNSGNGFEIVGYITGFGTTTESHSYSYVDGSLQEGSYTYRLKQIDFDGTFEYSEAVEVDVNAPSVFALEQNYPNPFNPSTQINFSLAVDSRVSLTVFDVLGQEVANLISGNLAAGSHEFNFNASNINSGVYFYRIDAAGVDGTNFTSVKKMILTK